MEPVTINVHNPEGRDIKQDVERAMRLVRMTATSTGSQYICPDLLRLSDLGGADNWRGRVVRGFFRVLGWVTGV